MRLRRLFWLIPLLALPAAGAAAWWLLASEAGLAWAWARTTAALDGRLGAERVSGRLLGPLRAEGLRLEQDGVRLDIDTLALDWRPGWLLTGRVAVHDLAAQGIRLAMSTTGQAGAAPPALPALPLGVSVERAVLRDLSLQRPGSPPLRADEVRFDGRWRGTRLLLAPLIMRGPWGELSLEGRVATGPGRESALAAQWALTYGGRTVAGSGRLSGPFDAPRLAAQLSAPFALRADATVAWQESPLRWRAEFELPPLDLAQLQAGWPALTVGGRGRLAGTGREFTVAADGTVVEEGTGPWGFSGRAGYGAAGVRVERLALRPQQGRGEVVLDGDWPGGEAAARLAARWEGFSHPRLDGWRSDGSLSVSGLPQEYRGHLALGAERDGLPPLQVSTDFAGNLAGIELTALAGQWLAGEWQGQAALGWGDGLDWHGRLRAAGVNPGLLDARWSGALAGEAAGRGRWHDGRLGITLPHLTLDGTLAGRPLRLEAAAGLEGRQASIERLELRSGTARISARGGAGTAWGLRWQLEAPALAALWPGAAGRLNLSGRIDGPEQTPRLRLDGTGQGLAWAGMALAQATVQADIDLAGKHPWRLETQLAGLERGGQRLDAARLRAHGSAAQHDIALSLQGAGNTLEVTAGGRWTGRRWDGELQGGGLTSAQLGTWQAAPAALSWSPAEGRLQPWCWSGQGVVCLGMEMAAGKWQATGALANVPLPLLEPWLPRSDLALGGSIGGAVTMAGEQDQVGMLTARLGGADARLLYRLPEGAVESTLRTLQLDVDGTAAGLAGQLQVVAVDGGQAQLRLALPGWLPGRPLLDAQPVSGRFDLDAERLDWLTYLEPNLLRPAGTLRAHLRLAGTLADPALSGELALQGGSVMLPAAGTRLTDISLEGRSADGRTLTLHGAARSGPGQLTLTGVLAAEHFGHWRAELGLRGERFELVRLVQGQALVSPDLTVTLEPDAPRARGGQSLLPAATGVRVTVRGRLEVPQADIQLPHLPTVVSVSPDEVILDAAAEEAALRRWRLALDLQLAAGERVRLEGYGFSGRLAGAVTVRGETPGLTRAQGELHVRDGRYEAYGQNLVVERGRLLFADSPPDNPGLDIRAVRPLPDREQVVGVEVGGRLKDPRLRLFSEPVLEESETLAWLVLGRPLTATSRTEADALYRAAFALGGERAARGIALQFGLDEVTLEQGATGDEAAVVLGKYLSPRLYLQYAVGLWETANRLRLRYQLSTHWSLKMEQGGEQSGADLQYVIER